jgi:hypothetical protein
LWVAALGSTLRSGEHIHNVTAALIIIVKEVVHGLFNVVVGAIYGLFSFCTIESHLHQFLDLRMRGTVRFRSIRRDDPRVQLLL